MNTNNAYKEKKYNRWTDALTEVLQNGAAKMLATVIEAEVEAGFLRSVPGFPHFGTTI